MKYNNNSDDLFFQVKKNGRDQLKIKGSRFITTIRKVTTIEEVEQVLEEVKKEFSDATHNCYAWKVGHNKKSKYRYSDDGEPNNTAGLPIFKVITARKLTNIIIIITRYFGGIKLGTGGLIKAYSKAAMSVIKQCEIEKSYQTETAVFKTSFEFTSLVHNIVASFNATLKDSLFEDEITFTVAIRSSKYKEFKTKLKDGTNGQVEFLK